MSFKIRRASSIERSVKVEAYSWLPIIGEPSTICPEEEI